MIDIYFYFDKTYESVLALQKIETLEEQGWKMFLQERFGSWCRPNEPMGSIVRMIRPKNFNII